MSSQYKMSTYTYQMQDKDGFVLLYNSLTGKIIKVGKMYQRQLRDILSNYDFKDNSDLLSALIDAKILVSKNFDENVYIDNLRDKMVNKNEILDIMIYPTEACNMRCKYCWENFSKGHMNVEIETAIIRYLEKQIPHYKRLYIKWFGGEPLLNISTIEHIMKSSIEICRQHGVILTSSMTTNGYLLTPEMIKHLIKYKIYEYQVTVDGLKVSHDKMRVLSNGNGSFDTIINNLIRIKETVTNQLIRILIRTNFSKDNIDSIHEYAQFYVREFSGDKRFSAYWNAVQNWGGDAVHLIEDKLIDNYDKTQINRIAAQYDIPLIIENALLSPGGYACYAGKKNSFIIGSDGVVYKCPQKIYDEYNQIGIVNKDGEMILQQDKYEQWTAPFTEEKCATCIMLPSCLAARCPKRQFTGQSCKFQTQQLERALQTYASNRYNCIEFI